MVHLISFSDRKPSNRTAIIARELRPRKGMNILDFIDRFYANIVLNARVVIMRVII